MTEAKIPVDIFAVKKYGIDRWQKEFFWPVSSDDFANLYRDIQQCLTTQMNSQSDEIKTLMGVQYKLKLEYLNFLHALKVVQETQSNEKTLLYSDKAWWYKNLIEGKPMDSHISTLCTTKSDFIRTAESKGRALIKSFIYNKHFLKYFISARKGEITQLFGQVMPIVKQYIEKVPDWVYFIIEEDWLSGGAFYKIPGELEREIEEFSKSLINALNSAADKNRIKLLKGHIKHLEELTRNELIYTARAFYLIKNKFEKSKKRVHLLTSAIGNLFARVLSVVVRQYGGRVTAFDHGGNVGFANSPTTLSPFFDIPFVDEFIVYTKENAVLLEKLNNNYSHCLEHKLRIVSGESDEFFKLWKIHGSGALPEKNRKVMIIGYPHSQLRRPLVVNGGFSLIHLDLELRLIDALKKAGYEVIYKAHPGRIHEVEGVFENRAQILKGYFKDCLDKADVFLFLDIATTAFAPALCSSKAVITLDVNFKLFEPFPEAMELFKKRCRIIHAKFDERNRLMFNEKELLDTLAQKPGPPNTEFIEKYMFPEKVKAGRL